MSGPEQLQGNNYKDPRRKCLRMYKIVSTTVKLLSKDGKEIMIKSVVYAILTYVMSCFFFFEMSVSDHF